MHRPLIVFILLIAGINPVHADHDMTSDLICPCECAMVISTCDCTTAIQIKKEITQMKENGFSEKQVFSALKAEYGNGILAHPENNSSMLLWMGGVSLTIIFAIIGYIFTKKTKMEITPDMKKYEQRFEEEYRKFVCELDKTSNNIKTFSNGSSNLEGK